MKLQKRKYFLLFTIITVFTIFIFTSCKKEIQQEVINKKIEKKLVKRTVSKPNPFSLANINKAKVTLGRTDEPIDKDNENDKVYSYIKFDPKGVTGEILKLLEGDSSIQILAFPFANGELYNDEFALDERKAIELADGNLYAVVKKYTPNDELLKSTSTLNAVVLDELYLPQEEDTTLQFQAFREIGYTEPQIDRFRLCLFKRPSGFVRYLDTETDMMNNVKGMQVWGLVFGIPIHTSTDENGYYNFPWRFNAGTIMGTKAKNARVNIKPLNTQGIWISTLTYQFIVGSVHIHGWVGSCEMRSDVNFDFREHKQNRFWAQLMHAVTLHDQYTEADDITRAPGNLTIYAHWADIDRSSSAPMLGHLTDFNTASIALQYLADLLGAETHNDFPNIFNLLTGLLPDVTIRTNGTIERRSYSARLMQIAFHELGHASHFQRAGQSYWYDVIRATLRRHPEEECGGSYGCGQNADDGNVGITESWAEFIGTNYALRLHPDGEKLSRWAGSLPPTFGVRFIRNRNAIERERWFFNEWIASGIYNDLIDTTNTDQFENIWDRTGGLTIQQLYEVFGPNMDAFCSYRQEIISRYGLNEADVNEIFWRNGALGCL